jgi:hypothetical protein
MVRAGIAGLLVSAALAGCGAGAADPTPAVSSFPPGPASIGLDKATNTILIDAPLTGKYTRHPDPSAGEYDPVAVDGTVWMFEFRTDGHVATVAVSHGDYDRFSVGTHLILRCVPAHLCELGGRR